MLTLWQGRDSSQGHSETVFQLSGADELGRGSEVVLSQGKQVIQLCLSLTLHTACKSIPLTFSLARSLQAAGQADLLYLLVS